MHEPPWNLTRMPLPRCPAVDRVAVGEVVGGLDGQHAEPLARQGREQCQQDFAGSAAGAVGDLMHSHISSKSFGRLARSVHRMNPAS